MKRSPLIYLSAVSLVLAAGLYGCETPEAFHLAGDGSLLASGTGGDDSPDTGTGGSAVGTGGVLATGGSGSFGTGGVTTPAGGSTVHGSGGAGGHVSTGGTAAGGHVATSSGGMAGHASGGTVATGGTPAGGSVGSGGRATGGTVGSGGTSPGSGGSANGGHTAAGGSPGMGGSAAGGADGTGPCAGLCAPATDFKFTSGTSYPMSPNLGTTAACYEVATTLTIQGGGCNNCMSRTVKINGTTAVSTGSWTAIPAKVNGGYCFQFSAGNPDYTSFYTY